MVSFDSAMKTGFRGDSRPRFGRGIKALKRVADLGGKGSVALLLGVVVMLSASTLKASESATDRNWAFQPIERPPLPLTQADGDSRNAIDVFVSARRLQQGFEPAPRLTKRALLRRLYLDLTGLPPEWETGQRFLKDPRPDAYEQEVERLLGTPQYGERWARHWMDVVRYADTDGFAIDAEKPTMWRYRDYLIRALNQDRPYDRFVREQLAGDELDLGSEGEVAVGFYRLGPWEADNMIALNRRQDYLNEITGTIGTAFLGLTVGCARCHDHKYDPIPTEDFYGLQAFVAPIKREDRAASFYPGEVEAGYHKARHRVEKEWEGRKEALERARQAFRARIAAQLGKKAPDLTDAEFDAGLKDEGVISESERKEFEAKKTRVSDYKVASRYASVAVSISNPEASESLPDTHVLRGGDVTAKDAVVAPNVLSAVGRWKGAGYASLEGLDQQASGRRSVLADWIAHPSNPLTARVIVNRIWQHHFGVGLVATPNDFGVNGARPTHPLLLDYLSSELIRQGWRLKPLHRLILTSNLYRQSSRHPRVADYARRDPDNRYLWRAHYRRLEAEALRDAMLQASGELNQVGGGPGFRDALPQEMGTKFPFFTWVPASLAQQARRSVYLFQRRNMVNPFLESFDVADASESCGRRIPTVNATQAFALLNSEFAGARAEALAARVVKAFGKDPDAQVEGVFRLTLGRPPSDKESSDCLQFLDSADEEGLRDLSLALLNANEFCYME